MKKKKVWLSIYIAGGILMALGCNPVIPIVVAYVGIGIWTLGFSGLMSLVV